MFAMSIILALKVVAFSVLPYPNTLPRPILTPGVVFQEFLNFILAIILHLWFEILFTCKIPGTVPDPGSWISSGGTV